MYRLLEELYTENDVLSGREFEKKFIIKQSSSWLRLRAIYPGVKDWTGVDVEVVKFILMMFVAQIKYAEFGSELENVRGLWMKV